MQSWFVQSIVYLGLRYSFSVPCKYVLTQSDMFGALVHCVAGSSSLSGCKHLLYHHHWQKIYHFHPLVIALPFLFAESAKLRALSATYLLCSCASHIFCLTCFRALRVSCLACFHASVPCVLRTLLSHVPRSSCALYSTCSCTFRAFVPYVTLVPRPLCSSCVNITFSAPVFSCFS